MATTVNRSPGVYWNAETPAPVQTLRSGVVGLVGLSCKQLLSDQDRVQLLSPTRLTLMAQLEQTLGKWSPDTALRMAVTAFFANGGSECWVVLQPDLLPQTLESSLGVLETSTPVDLICAPFIMDPAWELKTSDRLLLQEVMLDACLAQGSWFALLDGPGGSGADASTLLKGVQDQQIRLSAHPGALNSALYFPWVKVVGSCLACHGTGKQGQSRCTTCNGSGNGFIPPSAGVAGIYARLDQQYGPHRAPANEAIDSALDLEMHITNAQQAILNPLGINCLRTFPGRGIRVWGARTLSPDPLWCFINVRRLILTVSRSVDQLASAAVFEPNDLALWIRLSRELNAWFLNLFQQGALKGNTQDEAFYIKCDAETNPPAVRDRGELIIEVGLAPATPGEFIVIKATASTESGGAESASGQAS